MSAEGMFMMACCALAAFAAKRISEYGNRNQPSSLAFSLPFVDCQERAVHVLEERLPGYRLGQGKTVLQPPLGPIVALYGKHPTGLSKIGPAEVAAAHSHQA